VLLAEDEARLCELLTDVLRDHGYKVLTARDGAEALRMARQQGGLIDLLVTDVVMPGMRGQVLAKELLRRNSSMAVIYMSGYTDNALVHHDAIPKGVAFLQKPFTPEVLLRRVREVLDVLQKERQPRNGTRP
jgi:DNA-binding response OmpR family regulator